MKIKKIRLVNFRNHQDFTAEFNKTNIILGPNASGKTSILEAIYFLSTSKSFRTTENGNLVSFDSSFAKAKGVIEDEDRQFSLQIVIEKNQRTKKQLKIDEKPRPIISMLGLFLAVIFTPETLSVVLGSPVLRRRSMDILLSSVSKKYASTLLQFFKIIRQRNHLLYRLKEKGGDASSLDAWDQGFVENALFLQKQRDIFLKQINTFLPKSLQIKYQPSPPDNLENKLKENRRREIEAGFTLIGPQKDDFLFLWKTRQLSFYGSRGEIREGAILFKLAEWEFIKEKTHHLPVLLLDDMFSELDREKRKKLETLLNRGQTILTATSLSYLSPKTIKESKVIEL